MLNYFSMVIGTLLSSTATGIRNPKNGRIISRKSLQQLGVITFASGDNREVLIADAMSAGYDIVLSQDGMYASLYAPVSSIGRRK